MKHYFVKSSRTDVLDTSSIGERDRTKGDTEFLLEAWNDNGERDIFETSQISVKLSHLPIDLQKLWGDFQKQLIAYILAS